MSRRRFLATWAALALLMSANGVLRELLLRPRLPGRLADLLSALFGIGLVLLVTRIGFRPLAGEPLRRLAWVSAAFVGLTLAFEFGIGRAVDRKSWAELVGDYAVWDGRLWPVVLLIVALTPFLWGRWLARGPL